jgi:hypothetical protein
MIYYQADCDNTWSIEQKRKQGRKGLEEGRDDKNMIQRKEEQKQNSMHIQKRQDDNDNNLLLVCQVKSGLTRPDQTRSDQIKI